MKITFEFNDFEVDSNLAADYFAQAREKIVEMGYKLYYEPENDEYYWLNRPLTAWEEKDFNPIVGEELENFLRKK